MSPVLHRAGGEKESQAYVDTLRTTGIEGAQMGTPDAERWRVMSYGVAMGSHMQPYEGNVYPVLVLPRFIYLNGAFRLVRHPSWIQHT